MKDLSQHKDLFYRLLYSFNGKIENKNIKVTPKTNEKSLKFVYNTHTPAK